jgi:SacI homology domain
MYNELIFLPVPLYWSQSPYSLHPIPVLDRPEAENEKAIELHFDKQKRIYGRQIIVNLAEVAGREAIVGAEYRRLIEKMADPNIKYVSRNMRCKSPDSH